MVGPANLRIQTRVDLWCYVVGRRRRRLYKTDDDDAASPSTRTPPTSVRCVTANSRKGAHWADTSKRYTLSVTSDSTGAMSAARYSVRNPSLKRIKWMATVLVTSSGWSANSVTLCLTWKVHANSIWGIKIQCHARQLQPARYSPFWRRRIPKTMAEVVIKQVDKMVFQTTDAGKAALKFKQCTRFTGFSNGLQCRAFSYIMPLASLESAIDKN